VIDAGAAMRGHDDHLNVLALGNLHNVQLSMAEFHFRGPGKITHWIHEKEKTAVVQHRSRISAGRTILDAS
jgi:hypothetical protein